eukprot:TRINITY_DN3309_c0_g1_i1.p1 TRINITY_DN3309_c0_g1~~TRINITY_DN3309_c0_g1_i1.p1  ORF type:complete len:362 (-),score=105.18 TRINITY_DN3309_c0_g1_i1:23-1108(-)
MACCGKGQSIGTPEENGKNKEIEKVLSKEKKKNKIKLLLLGAGESGKSTIAKQMRIIHHNGYSTDEEKLKFRRLVFTNLLDNIKNLMEAADNFQYELQRENQEAQKTIFSIESDHLQQMDSKGFGEELGSLVQKVWKDPAIQKSMERASEFQLNDTAPYFFANLERIASPQYIPSTDDILQSRQRTTGIIETDFSVNNFHFGMTDVGGQRSERRKWIHTFDDVTAIIFVASLSEYDQRLYEDQNTNRMMEALKLFRDITNSRWFENTPIILFLNKEDLFREKIQRVPLSVCFKDYKGANEFTEASTFIKNQFLAQCQNNTNRRLYVYTTCATDTKQIAFIFNATKDMIIKIYLEQLGMGSI